METSREEFPAALTRNAHKEAGNTHGGSSATPQMRTQSRIPQTSTSRRPRAGPPLTHETQAWSSPTGINNLPTPTVPTTATVSTQDPVPATKTRNVLRRKQSPASLERGSPREHFRKSSGRSDSSSSIPRSQNSLDSYSSQMDRSFTESPMEVQVAQKVELPRPVVQATGVYPELDRYRNIKVPTEGPGTDILFRLATHDLPPPTPLFSGGSSHSTFSASPSTHFSESPGPGPYSRDTTPTSMSSVSPGLVAPSRTALPKLRHASPADTRPPVSRRRAGSLTKDENLYGNDPQGLAAVREALTSSSSNSTVRDDRRDPKHKRSISSGPSSPPPRKSSQKLRKVSESDASPYKSGQPTTRPALMRSPSPAKSPVAHREVPQRVFTSPQSGKVPPARPSREGTPNMASQFGGPVPIIHSNLSSSSVPERRQSGQLALSALPRSTTPASGADRTAVSRPTLSREPTPAPRSDSSTGSHLAKPTRPTRTPSPGVSGFKSRFGLFGRRKTDGDVPQVEKKERVARKGPTAGTGHEGYGRLTIGKRRSTNMSNPPKGAHGANSSESLSSAQTDSFLLERMNPVVIAGGEIIQNKNTSSEWSRTESDHSLALRRPSNESRDFSSTSLSSRDEPRNTLWPSAFPRDSIQSRRPSEGSDSEPPAAKPTLAYRRSLQRLRSSPDQQPLRLPKPIVTNGLAPTALGSIETTLPTDDSFAESHTEVGQEKANHPAPKKLTKRPKSPRKWNLFSRSLNRSAPTLKKTEESAPVAATVKAVQSKPVAFYTMMDNSEQEDNPAERDMAAILREAEVLPPVQPTAEKQAHERKPSHEKKPSLGGELKPVHERKPSLGGELKPVHERKPSFGGELKPAHERKPSSGGEPKQLHERKPSLGSTQTHERKLSLGVERRGRFPVKSSAPQTSAPSAPRLRTPSASREPRAQPVATRPHPPAPAAEKATTVRPSRLPQVGRIPKVVNTRPDQTSPKSFSRPFHRISLQPPPLFAPVVDRDSVAMGPSPPEVTTPELSKDESTEATAESSSPKPRTISRDSCCSAMSEDEEQFLVFAPRKDSEFTVSSSSTNSGLLSYANQTAVLRGPTASLAEDEIWDEYNDLLGDVPPSATSSRGIPFHLEGYESRLAKKEAKPLVSPTINVPPPVSATTKETKQSRESVDTCKSGSNSSHLSADMTARINAAFRFQPEAAVAAPSTPFSVSEFVSGYGDRNSMESPKAARAVHRSSSSSGQSIKHPGVRASDSSCTSEETPLSQVNLRVGSMTVSKWLTFGHVLFSPAREDLVPEVGSLKRHSVLVIDGLGNDDWSFYAAETYPAATFFNLSPRAPIVEEPPRTANSFTMSPPNHHQIQYLSHKDKFPFGPDSFSAVVFRFPSAAPEAYYRNIISEARRVLKPGGYIELAILDVDLVNMGNRTRRAVRRLKERINMQHPDYHLSSTADLVLRLLARKGLIDVKTCRVGVPVASAITGRPAAEKGTGKKKKRDERSLAEMMNDETETGDENITKMVAKVGRWWYNRLYESAAGAPTSIWSDKALLAECEEWGTSLKLMVCHARMPETRSRVSSI